MNTDVYIKLKQLYGSAPTSPETLGRWYQDAGELVALLRSMPEMADQVPVRVWQFLSDADIRMKDEEYAASQNRILRVFLAGLNEGRILSGKQIDERMEAEAGRTKGEGRN